MSDQPRVKLGRLQLHPETIRDLTVAEAENVRGGAGSESADPVRCAVYSGGAGGAASAGAVGCNYALPTFHRSA